jgi:hypothetical protein
MRLDESGKQWKAEIRVPRKGIYEYQFIIDELAMQVISQEFGDDCQIFDCRYNCSPTHAGATDDVRIWHFHGDKHLRKPEGRERWLPKFQACLAANPGGFADWAGQFDSDVAAVRKELSL